MEPKKGIIITNDMIDPILNLLLSNNYEDNKIGVGILASRDTNNDQSEGNVTLITSKYFQSKIPHLYNLINEESNALTTLDDKVNTIKLYAAVHSKLP